MMLNMRTLAIAHSIVFIFGIVWSEDVYGSLNGTQVIATNAATVSEQHERLNGVEKRLENKEFRRFFEWFDWGDGGAGTWDCTCRTPGAGAGSGRNAIKCQQRENGYAGVRHCADYEECYSHGTANFGDWGALCRPTENTECRCSCPGRGAGNGDNRITCTSGEKRYCGSHEQCYSRNPVQWGDWGNLCKRPGDDECRVTLYEHDKFKGDQRAYGAGNIHLIDHHFNDGVSSIRVRGSHCYVIVYEHAGYEGWSVKLWPGNYWLSDLLPKGFKNDHVSSLKLQRA